MPALPNRFRFTTVAVLALAAGSMLASSSASGQVVYAPVKYQYDRQNPFYYAGDDPRVFRRAVSPVGGAGRFGRVNGFDFASGRAGRTDVYRTVAVDRPQLYTDAIPGYNGFIFGLTVDDVRNEANARVPRYFAKSDLLAAAVPTGPTSAVVPAVPPAAVPAYPGPRPIFGTAGLPPELVGGVVPDLRPVGVPHDVPLGGITITPAVPPPARRPAAFTPAAPRPLMILPRRPADPAPATPTRAVART